MGIGEWPSTPPPSPTGNTNHHHHQGTSRVDDSGRRSETTNDSNHHFQAFLRALVDSHEDTEDPIKSLNTEQQKKSTTLNFIRLIILNLVRREFFFENVDLELHMAHRYFQALREPR